MESKTNRLFEAAQAGDLEKVKGLVRGGASINAKDNNGDTALTLAAYFGHSDIVRYLVELGANKDDKDNDGNTALIWAANRGHMELVRILVEHGADKEAKNNKGDTALTSATYCNNMDMVRYLVEHGADKEVKNNDGWTTLISAAYNGQVDVVRYLVEQGANIEAKDNNVWTAMISAANRGHADVVRYLATNGADKEVKNSDGDTALIVAVSYRRMDVVRCLVEQGANKEAKNRRGDTALTLAANSGYAEVVRYLVEQGADKETKNCRGDTALTLAAFRDYAEVVRYLIEQGADKEAKNSDGWTALIWAARCGQPDLVRYLVEQGADKESKNNNGWTALMEAARYGHVDVVKYLVEQGADKESKNNNGWTALIWAAYFVRVHVVLYLVEQGADASCLDNEGNSVLMHLLQREDIGQYDILPTAKLLLEHRTPPLQLNKQGKSAKSIARFKKLNDIVDLLEEYAATPRRDPEGDDSKWFISPDAVKMTDGVVGQGSFTAVYRATWAQCDVVVKEILVVELRQFLKEVNTWRELRHDNIVPFYGANHREEPYFIVSKYASNGELRKYLAAEKEQGQIVVWRKLREVTAGLSYLHQHGIVHGDLKGNNIVVAHDGTAMLADFGLSFSESGSCSLTKMKETLGAMAWRAPEFAMMTVETPTRMSDIFSLGMCIIEAVKGAAPWGENLSSEDIRQIYRNGEFKIDKPAELTDVQWQLVKSMLAISPGDRPDLVEVMRAVQQFAEAEKDEEHDKECPY